MDENLDQNINPSTEPVAVTPTLLTNQPPFGNWWRAGILVVGILLAGSIAYAGYQYSQKQPKPTPPPTIFPTSAPISPPQTITTPTPDETANWRAYTNNELSFKYPQSWTTATGTDRIIIGTNPDIVVDVAMKAETLMNECMKLDTTEKKIGFVIKKFSRVTTGEMCSTNDPSPREIWVIPTENDYSPGISYSYSIKDRPEAEQIFNQILSTLQFLN